MFRLSNDFPRWGILFSLLFLVVFCDPIQGISAGPSAGYRIKNGDRYFEHGPSKEWMAFNGKHKGRKIYQGMTPEERARIHENFQKWKSLPTEQQKKLRHRMDRWKELPPENQKLYQKRLHQWKNLSPGDRRKIRKNLKEWKRLTPQQKKKLRRKFRDRSKYKHP